MTEDEMVGWHHRLNGHEFEQAPGVGDGQGSLACCSPWGRNELEMTVIPFSSCPQSFPASGSFPMSQLFTSGGQSIAASASTSVLPMNTQD